MKRLVIANNGDMAVCDEGIEVGFSSGICEQIDLDKAEGKTFSKTPPRLTRDDQGKPQGITIKGRLIDLSPKAANGSMRDA